MPYTELAGKTALVTGGANGLGRAIVTAFLLEGACVAFCDIDEHALVETEAALSGPFDRLIAIRANVAEGKDVSGMIETIMNRFGRLDFLINNAGVRQVGLPLGEIGEDEYHRVMDINLKGTWLCIKHAVPAMLANGGGAIVNISSAMGLVAQKNVAIYCASKHAVIGLTRAAALDYGPQNIRVNAICPGSYETPMTADLREGSSGDWNAHIRKNQPATGRAGRPGEIAATTTFLCSDGASNIHGVALPVDGGWTVQ
jgi:NAD(P)-dependent dehydrogenase (short-subunit alcohol dehydrogenase family)